MKKIILNVFAIVWLILAIVSKGAKEIESFRMCLIIMNVFICGTLVVNDKN